MAQARGRKRPRRCCYCGARVHRDVLAGKVYVRAWCLPCLQRIRLYGVVDLAEYPTQHDYRRVLTAC